MNFGRYFLGFAAALMVAICGMTSASASTILVGQCYEFEACYDGPFVPFSTTLTGAQLGDLGLGTDQPLVVGETSQFVIRLSGLQAVFQTPGGPVTQTLPEFSGSGNYNDPCLGFCEVDQLGFFSIPIDATSAEISGIFGNSVIDSSAAECVWIGTGDAPVCTAVRPTSEPEPLTLSLFGAGLAGAAAMRRRKMKSA